MTKMPFASKSPKGKGSNGHKPTGAMTNFGVQTKPQSGRGLNAGNHPTTAGNDKGGKLSADPRPSNLKKALMKMNGMSLSDLNK